MNLANKIFTFLLLSIFIIPLSAQEVSTELDKNTLDKGTIENQMEYLIEKSNRYQHYKVVERTWLDKVKNHVSDTLSALRNNIAGHVATIKNLENQITERDKQLTVINNDLNTVTAEKDNMVFFGTSMSKGGYSFTMWSIVGLCFVAFLFFLFKFKRSNNIAQECKSAYNQVQNEFESFRKKSREKEQVLKRELQNELNKHMEGEVR